ncbi:hypothetical protein METHB2_50092 [Candidatus Methylobacter favarea]|uniref:Uncharacterized protein n=1 Tax=Candidatus Methylobacter favarea TaxID=2707345 RepID=A0A8S0XHF8_9GAMM|nr:hypothetical protein METHB2_50092 [Candidatus Methylobacter favarea]
MNYKGSGNYSCFKDTEFLTGKNPGVVGGSFWHSLTTAKRSLFKIITEAFTMVLNSTIIVLNY